MSEDHAAAEAAQPDTKHGRNQRATIDGATAPRIAGVVLRGEFDERGDAQRAEADTRAHPARSRTVAGIAAILGLWGAAQILSNSQPVAAHAAAADGSLGAESGIRIPGVPGMKKRNSAGMAVVSTAAALTTGYSALAGNAVQWRVEDGGNGHWYRFVETPAPRTWQAARDWATTIDAHLATITDPAEQAFIISIAPAYQDESGGQAWLGGYQDLSAPDFEEPHGGWRWITGEPMTYQPWVNAGQTAPGSDFLAMARDIDGRYGWNDLWTDYFGGRRFCFIEFDADCNADGIVDYGQILSGQFADTNGNGVPDTCECATNPALPPCCPGDIYRNGRVDGADLGVLLSEWGSVTPLTNSDLDGNGQVNGADLGILLSNWGPCGG